jgi:flagellar basal-body rod modification protein FlgD
MDIQATQTAGAISSPLPKAESTSAISSDFNTFLKMLTAQMKNQDPLNPIESSDYAVQLATFSQVEQQVETNDLLRNLASSGAYGGLDQHAGWVGMEARTSGSVQFSGVPVELHFEKPIGVNEAELVVSGPGGQEIHRKPVTEDSPLMWNGKSPTGSELLAGEYTLKLETRSSTGRVETHDISTFGRITEVRADTDGPKLVLADGSVISAEEVSALRQKD